MPILRSSTGEWDLPHCHEWSARETEIAFGRCPIIGKDTVVATIGSCFAVELATTLDRWNLRGGMNPTGNVYNTRSVRQEIDRAFGGWPEKDLEPYWETQSGVVSPFHHPRKPAADPEALAAKMQTMENQATELFNEADVIVVTLGLIEAWFSPNTVNCYRYIPHPDVYPTLGAKFHRLTVQEMKEDLVHIRNTIQQHSNAKMIVTVSPIPLHSTMTSHDVRIANCESKSRIRAAVSEFIEEFPDVYYFHSYEIVTASESLSKFMKEDGRHLHRPAVDYIMQRFLRCFGDDSISIPDVDLDWMATLG